MKKNNFIAPFVFIVASVQLFISSSTTATVTAEVALIEKLDLDKDGQVTIKESVAAPSILASFGRIDTDGNGRISSVELAKTKLLDSKEKNISKFE